MNFRGNEKNVQCHIEILNLSVYLSDCDDRRPAGGGEDHVGSKQTAGMSREALQHHRYGHAD